MQYRHFKESTNLICFSNLGAVLAGKDPQAKYDGYTSCPLVTGRKTCVLAEFDFQVKKKIRDGNQNLFWINPSILKPKLRIQIHTKPVKVWIFARINPEFAYVLDKSDILHTKMSI